MRGGQKDKQREREIGGERERERERGRGREGGGKGEGERKCESAGLRKCERREGCEGVRMRERWIARERERARARARKRTKKREREGETAREIERERARALERDREEDREWAWEWECERGSQGRREFSYLQGKGSLWRIATEYAEIFQVLHFDTCIRVNLNIMYHTN